MILSPQKNFGLKNLGPKKFMNKILRPTFFLDQPNCGSQKLGPKTNLGLKRVWVLKTFWVQKFVCSKRIFYQKKCWFQQIFGTKKVLCPKRIVGPKYHGSKKIVDPKNFVDDKKIWGRKKY